MSRHFKLDLSELPQIKALDLGSVAAELNVITNELYATARGRMIAGINLTEAYIDSHMQLELATPGARMQAAIVAPQAGTPLSRYMRGQVTKAAPRAKGDSKRGIAAGRKQAGIEVEVGRGQAKVLPNAFTMTLKNGNGLGIFTRTKYGLKRHRYGPAPYQLFRVAATELEETAGDTVEERLSLFAAKALERAIA